MSFLSHISQVGSPASKSGLLRGGPLVAGVEVSVLVSESHKASASATKLALESGAQVSDHIIVDPDEVSVVFAMTNVGSGADTARDVFETFKRMCSERQLVELATEHHVYKDMAITSVTPMHQAPYKGALSFTISLQQISFVQLESVGRAPKTLSGKTAKTASGKVNAGQQEPKGLSAMLGKASESFKKFMKGVSDHAKNNPPAA